MSPDTTVTVILLVGSIGWVLATIGLCAWEARREERRAAMLRHPAGRSLGPESGLYEENR